MKVAVIGAGISGLACARRLLADGVDVRIFDKSRGLGGRMATRRGDGVAFDHGAQYFTAADPRFAAQVTEWEQSEVVGEWEGRIVVLKGGATQPAGAKRRLVAVPCMSSLAGQLATPFEVERSFLVARIESGSGLTLYSKDDSSADGFDVVVLALPAPQVVPLVQPLSVAVAQHAADANYAPCWAVMIALDAPLAVDFDGAFVEDSPLSWIARNNSKPGRSEAECWVLHTSPEWSRTHLEDQPEHVLEAILCEFRRVTRASYLPPVAAAAAHRWAYSLPHESAGGPCVFDGKARVGACGDWCSEARVEGAFLSGLALAERVLAS